MKQHKATAIMALTTAITWVSTSQADITAGVAEQYYSNPFAGKNVASFDWDSSGNLYWMEGDNNYAQDIKIHKIDGSLSTIYTAAAYSGTWVCAYGDNIYFDNGSEYAFYKYDSIGGGSATSVFQQDNAWGYTFHNGGLFISGADGSYVPYLYWTDLDVNGDPTGSLVNLGQMSSPSGPVAFDASGNLYYGAGYSDGKIYKFSASEVADAIGGTPLSNPAAHEFIDFSAYARDGVTGIDFNYRGNLVGTLTAFSSSSYVVEFDLDGAGNYLGTSRILAESDGRMTTVRYANGNIYFSDPDGVYRVAPGGDGKAMDVNGDSDSDVIVRNASTGAMTVWNMQDNAKNSESFIGGLGADWDLIGSSDLDNDNDADLVLFNDSTDRAIVWFMQDGVKQSGTFISGFSGWTIRGMGDLDADGDGDIVWQEESSGRVIVWIMENGIKQSGAFLGGLGAGSEVVAIGDFDYDGDADLLWSISGSNSLVRWTMQNGLRQSGANIGGLSGYTMIESGDFNRDGTVDVIWEGGGNLIVWLMQDGDKSTGTAIGSEPNYQLETVGDYDGDGDDDLVWVNAGTNDTIIWQMDNGVSVSSTSVGTVSTGFQIRP